MRFMIRGVRYEARGVRWVGVKRKGGMRDVKCEMRVVRCGVCDPLPVGQLFLDHIKCGMRVQ